MYWGLSSIGMKGRWSSLHSRGSDSVNRLKLGNWLGSHDSLFWWFNLDFCSLSLKLLCLYRSSKHFVGCASLSPLAHRDPLPAPQVSVTQTLLIAYLSPLSIMVVTPTLSSAVKGQHLVPATPRSNDPPCIEGSQLTGSRFHCNFSPSEMNKHRAIQGC